jgi:hypothetical protein
MQLPLSQNRLVALALAGVVLTGGVTALLAAPGVFGAELGGDDGGGAGPTAADAPPAANDSFTPAVQTQDGDYEDDEYEAYEDHESEDDGDEEEDGDEDDEEDEDHESLRPVEVAA